MSKRYTRRNLERGLECLMLASLALGACTVGPDFVRPQPQMPDHWSQTALVTAPPHTEASAAAATSSVREEPEEPVEWWHRFEDPTLDSLISRAVDANLDLRAAVLRIEEARAQRAVAASAWLPTLALDASYTRQRFSETTPSGALFNTVGNVHLPGGAAISFPNPYNQFQLSGSASWEIDVFGRVRRSVEAADANVQVSIEDHRAVQIAMLADVAQSYVRLRGAQTRLRVAQENLGVIDELLELTRQRLAAGLTTHIDVSNARAQAEVTRAQIPAFELEITQDVNQLSRLLGREPEALRAELEPAAPVPDVPSQVSIGVPAELARHRPDIREAEAKLHAATAQVGVAVADLFPRLTLSAGGGVQSESAHQLFDWASRFGSFGPSIDLPIFDMGRWRTMHLQGVRLEEAALDYRRTVLNALQETENAIAAYAADQERRVSLAAAVVQNRDALALSRDRYESGVTTFIDVLDVERNLQQNELGLAESDATVSADLVQIYRTLGGGWEMAVGRNR